MPPTMPPAVPSAVPSAIRSIQPETRRVVHPHNANTPFTMSTPLTPSSSLPNNVGQVIPATPPVLAPSLPHIPNTPIVATKDQTNPSIPTRPVPSHLQQPTQTHITPTHLMAIQQSPSAPSTPPALPTPATPISPQTLSVQPSQQFAPTQGSWNTAQVSPAQSVMPQQVQQRPQPVTSHSTRSAESYVATRNAAERWRTSWRNKQRSEAGPATEVSRGQSSVPEPLMAMQHSLARIRAIIKPQQREKRISVFWLSIVLLACLIIVLGAFILSTYTGNSATGNTTSTPPTIPPPSLTVKGPQGVTIQAGQMLHVHGDHFDIGDPILFLLDGANSISGTDGKEIALQVSNQGTFDVDLPVATSWSSGPHVIEAEDNKTGQTAYLSIQVGSTTLNSANSIPGLALSQSYLNFQAYIGQNNPKEQFITLTNSSNTAIPWTAKAVTDDSLNWLAVDPTTTGGTIVTGGTTQVGVETITASLKSNMPPYTGDILFNINGQQQLIVPVTLLVQNSAEWIFSPNPVTGIPSPQGGTCKAGTTLTLINLGNVPVFWHILTSNAATNHIQFMLNGKVDMQGVLAPSGQNDDTQVLTLVCTNVQNGASYPFTIDANNILWNGTVLMQNS
ncbi:MAG: hypothetical protein ACYDER_14630 [Ktedonobacteraceae bacterium]